MDQEISIPVQTTFPDSVKDHTPHKLPQSLINVLNSKETKINLQDLHRILVQSKDKDHTTDLKATFELFETEKGSARITPVSLWRTLSRHGDSTSYSQCVAMVEAFDSDRDGELNYDEFLEMMTTKENSHKGKLILNLEDVRKLLRISQLEKVKSRLRVREMEQDHVSYLEFMQICSDFSWTNDQSMEFAKILDESGTVIVLGNIVFLRPHQLVKAVQGLIPMSLTSPMDPLVMELEEMEKKKAAIDKKAELLARRELCFVLAYIIIQTAIIMILTYDKLSWNIMEPICYCMTYVYMIARFGFFLKTSKEPSFQGLFSLRFNSKQKLLMKIQNFNLERYDELLKSRDLPPSSPPPQSPSVEIAVLRSSSEDHAQKQRKKEE